MVSGLPELVQQSYRGELLTKILQMPKRIPISFNRSIFLVNEKCKEALQAGNATLYIWYYRNFIQYLSSAGYHIELSGEEFEVTPTIQLNA